MTRAMRRLTLPIALLGTGCLSSGDSSEFGALYEAPTGTSTASIHGLWGGAAEGIDTRWVLAPDQITLAARCGARTVGVEVAAEVSATQIRFLESKQAGSQACFVSTKPLAFVACSTDPVTPKENCFVHAQKQLTIHFSVLDELVLTKLSDTAPPL